MSVTARGGYQIIDFQNIPVPQGAENAAPVAAGVWDQVSNIGKKPIIIYNLILSFTGGGSSNYNPEFVAHATYNAEHGVQIQLDNDETSIMILPNGTAFCEVQ